MLSKVELPTTVDQAISSGNKKTNFVIAGEGGQGIQTAAKILTDALFLSGFEVASVPSFGVEQRGTPSVNFISMSKNLIRQPIFNVADYVIVLQTRALAAVERYISPNTKVIFDSSTIDAKDLPKTAIHVFGVPATKIASEKFNPKSFNLIIVGVVSRIIGIADTKIVWKSIEKNLGKKFKTDEIRNQNKDAFIFGWDAVFEKDNFTLATYKPKTRSVFFRGHGKSGELVPSRCKGCGICIEKCPVAALSFSEDLGVFATPVPKVDLEKCIACGNCRNFCPDGAISVIKEKDTR
jgi:2-oxoglutarate ferredoxin oxidoreductase subunit gamma